MNQIKGNGFIITEENGNYTMSWMTGGLQEKEVTYQVSKELVDKALRSEQDAYEVELFLETGEWVTKESKEIARQNYFRSTPTRILVNPSSVKRLFSNQEFEELMGIKDRTISTWTRGKWPIPPGIGDIVHRLLKEQDEAVEIVVNQYRQGRTFIYGKIYFSDKPLNWNKRVLQRAMVDYGVELFLEEEI